MNQPDTDDVLNYLSTKFNRIFCDREFVCCVTEDFQRIILDKKKCSVLVFPALGPIYLKALRYQAKIFGLAVFGIGNGKLRSIAVCQKTNLLNKTTTTIPANTGSETNQEEMVVGTAASASSNCRSSGKRPERQLYVPPAQRKFDGKHQPKIIKELKKSAGATSSNRNKLMNLNDTIDVFYCLNLIPYYSSSIFHCQNSNNKHWNCQFTNYIKYKQFNNSNANQWKIIPLYNLIKGNILWNYYQLLKFNYTEVKTSNNDNHYYKILPCFFNEESNMIINDNIIEEVKMKSVVIIQPSDNISYCYEQLLKEYHEQNVADNLYKIMCDKICDVNNDNYKIVDLSVLNLGHYCYISFSDGDFVFECQQQHDIISCCLEKIENKINDLTRMTKINEDLLSTENECQIIPDSKTVTEIIKFTDQNELNINNNNINKVEKKPAMKKNEHEQEIEIMRKAKVNMNRKIRPIMKYVDDDSNNRLRIDKNDSVNNWEDLFDDDGKIQDSLLTEIVEKVGSDVTIVKATEDYSCYANKPIEDLEHVVELYSFPSTFETHDLVQAFSDINSDAMYIKWVDDTHALLVLGSSTQAQKAMDMANPLIKVRPMTAATAVSIDVANKSNLKPAMKRPATNLQTARRLITSHLGTKSRLSKEQIAKEREDLKTAKELKKITKQNERDAWEGKLKSVVNN